MTIDTHILLATYNGGRYLRELLDSLDAQTDQNWLLLARDDGSGDDSVDILRTWGQKNPGRLRLIEDGVLGCGPSGNFGRLMAASDASYMLFCDQDDVWLPHKVAVTREKILKLEQQYGSHTPLLAHTDLEVVDGELNRLDPSFWHYQGLSPKTGHHLGRVLVQNVVTGCTAMINSALATKGSPIPKGAIMHDWWLVLVATAFGKVGEVHQSTIRYRQHGRNDTGAKHYTLWYMLRLAFSLHRRDGLVASISRTQAQAKAFEQQFSKELTPKQLSQVTTWADIAELGPINKRLEILRHGLFKVGLFRNLGLMMRV